MRISQWLWPPAMVCTSRTISKPGFGRSTMNAEFRACGGSASGSVQAIRIANFAPRAPEMNHLCPLMCHVVAVAHREGLDAGRVGARDLGLGHREARAHVAVAQRLQVLLALHRRGEVEQRVHVPFVRRLAVDDERRQRHAAALGRHRRDAQRPQPHAAVLLRHVRQPEPLLVRQLAQPDDLGAPLRRGRRSSRARSRRARPPCR